MIYISELLETLSFGDVIVLTVNPGAILTNPSSRGSPSRSQFSHAMLLDVSQHQCHFYQHVKKLCSLKTIPRKRLRNNKTDLFKVYSEGGRGTQTKHPF